MSIIETAIEKVRELPGELTDKVMSAFTSEESTDNSKLETMESLTREANPQTAESVLKDFVSTAEVSSIALLQNTENGSSVMIPIKVEQQTVVFPNTTENSEEKHGFAAEVISQKPATFSETLLKPENKEPGLDGLSRAAVNDVLSKDVIVVATEDKDEVFHLGPHPNAL